MLKMEKSSAGLSIYLAASKGGGKVFHTHERFL